MGQYDWMQRLGQSRMQIEGKAIPGAFCWNNAECYGACQSCRGPMPLLSGGFSNQDAPSHRRREGQIFLIVTHSDEIAAGMAHG